MLPQAQELRRGEARVLWSAPPLDDDLMDLACPQRVDGVTRHIGVREHVGRRVSVGSDVCFSDADSTSVITDSSFGRSCPSRKFPLVW